MTDRIRQADQPEAIAHQPTDPTATGGQARSVLTASHRVVTKSGRLSGGRACALSVRAASRARSRSDDDRDCG